MANVNDDSDGTTDETGDNSEYGYGDDVDLDTDHDDIPNSYEAASPAWVEPAAYDAEPNTEHARASLDWGDPGKQHATTNKYDD